MSLRDWIRLGRIQFDKLRIVVGGKEKDGVA